MIGKITKGTSFGGCVNYVLKEEKSRLLEAVGVEGTPSEMAEPILFLSSRKEYTISII